MSVEMPWTVELTLSDVSSGAAVYILTMEFIKNKVLPAASTGAGLGFEIGRRGTSFGLGIARTVSSGFVAVSSAAVDYSLGLSHPGQGLASGPTSQLASTLHVLAFDSIEYLAIGGINLGESLTSSSLTAVSTIIESINGLYGSDESTEAAFSLGAFVRLVRRELEADEERDRDQPLYGEGGRPGAVATAKALTAWAAIQAVTPEHGEKKVLAAIEPIDMAAWRGALDVSKPQAGSEGMEVTITKHESVPDTVAEIVTAEVGHPSSSPSVTPSLPTGSARLAKDRAYLRRISKIVLGAYGGAGLIFFGAPRPQPTSMSKETDANAQERQDHLLSDSVLASERAPEQQGRLDSWWDTVRGKNDRAIFDHYSKLGPDGERLPVEEEKPGEASYMGSDAAMPRFWVLTDHNRKEVVLALRGTMSLNELAIDLTCDPSMFSIPGDQSAEPITYQVHAGFLKIAQAMGGIDKPVHRAVSKALAANDNYGLVIAGHSLGAGVGGLMALMWADPQTTLSTASSGLPANRMVHAYCLACPCIVSADLARLSAPLITTLIYSYDFVSRLSLGSIRDLKRISDWLSFAMNSKNADGEKCKNIVTRALKYKAGMGGQSRVEEKAWFLALRKTLEAQMTCVHLYPAGETYHAFERQDFSAIPPAGEGEDPKVILYRVRDIEADFEQVVFSSTMLSCHLPHQYDRILSNHL